MRYLRAHTHTHIHIIIVVVIIACTVDARRRFPSDMHTNGKIIPSIIDMPAMIPVSTGSTAPPAPEKMEYAQLGNTGLRPDGAPVGGKIHGPFTAVRATTIPWNQRHYVGTQINGAPEPLVYSPIFTFQVMDKIEKGKAMDMLKDPDKFELDEDSTNAVHDVKGTQWKNAAKRELTEQRTFEFFSPQPPPYFPPKARGNGNGQESENGEGAPATDPSDEETE